MKIIIIYIIIKFFHKSIHELRVYIINGDSILLISIYFPEIFNFTMIGNDYLLFRRVEIILVKN
jgi:hypothetical protein